MACVRSNPPFEKTASVLCKFNEIMIRKALCYQQVINNMEQISNERRLREIPDGGYNDKKKFIKFLEYQAIMAGAEEALTGCKGFMKVCVVRKFIQELSNE